MNDEICPQPTCCFHLASTKQSCAFAIKECTLPNHRSPDHRSSTRQNRQCQPQSPQYAPASHAPTPSSSSDLLSPVLHVSDPTISILRSQACAPETLHEVCTLLDIPVCVPSTSNSTIVVCRSSSACKFACVKNMLESAVVLGCLSLEV